MLPLRRGECGQQSSNWAGRTPRRQIFSRGWSSSLVFPIWIESSGWSFGSWGRGGWLSGQRRGAEVVPSPSTKTAPWITVNLFD